MFKTFGLFFVQYQRKYSTTASVLSLVLSVQTIIASVSSIFIMGIGTTYFGERLMVICAAILGLGSNLGNAFAPQPSILFFTQSTLYALTSESAHLSAMLILGKYFEKRRGMAYAVANFGAGIGGLVLPQLVTYLFSEYGLRSTLIIIGGIHLHLFPIGLLMRPIERKTNKSQNINEIENHRLIKEEESPDRFSKSKKRKQQNGEHKMRDAVTASNDSLYKQEEKNENAITLLPPKSEEEQNVLSSNFMCSEDETVSISTGKSDFKNSKPNLENYSKQTENRKGLCLQFLFKIFDFSLFRNGKFNLLMTSSLLIAAACTIPVAYIPPFAKDQKLQSDMIGYLVTFSSASDLVGRFLFIFIADNKIIQKHHMMAIAMVVHGIVCLMAVFCTSFVSLAVFSILEAALGGTYYSLINILLVEFIGLDSLNHGLAVNRMTRGISIAITSTLIGVLRDNTGSYVGGFYLMGICSIVGGAILLFKPFVSKSENVS
ncbi:monocarboxylate transporter 9-like [Saccostrea echinata]|uniref:monocarboxylate transporter 9-like n=1 Tax=Saccostrea echinata TaxID=191078 RepID=UPI002A810DF5|nr:monocarboxylate transporter 9-like [Saccostrea echinata]